MAAKIMTENPSGKWCQMLEVQKAISTTVAQAVHLRGIVSMQAHHAHTGRVAQRQLEKEDKSPNAYQANEAQQTRAARSPQCKCSEAGCGRMYAQLVQLTNHHKDNHSELGLKHPFTCDRYASNNIHLVRNMQMFHSTRSVESKAKEVGESHEIRVHEIMSHNLISSVIRGFTTSITQRHSAGEEWREGESAESNETQHNELKEHVQNSFSTSRSPSSAFS